METRLPPNLRIGVLLRFNALEKPGGDSLKWAKIAPLLANNIGGKVTTFTDIEELLVFNPDVVILTNADFPLENYLRLKQLPRETPKLLMTICHPHSAIADYFNSCEDTFSRITSPFLSWDRAWLLKESIRLRKARGFFYVGRRFTQMQRKCFRLVDGLLAASIREAEFLATLTKCKVHVVANGIESIPVQKDGTVSRVRPRVIVIGRIEPRKNQLRVAQDLFDSNVDVYFAGAENDNHEKYLEKFRDLIATSTNLYYLGSLRSDELRHELSKSDIYINAAWFEVTSNADLEAKEAGLVVITTINSWDVYNYDFRLDPKELASNPGLVLNLVQEAIQRVEIKENSPVNRQSWESTALQLEAALLDLKDKNGHSSF